MFQKLDEFPSKNVNRKLKLWFLKKKKICPRLPLEIGTIDLYSMGEKVCLETVSSGQVDFKRHVSHSGGVGETGNNEGAPPRRDGDARREKRGKNHLLSG